MTISKATILYIGLSIGISLLLLAIVAVASFMGNLSIIEYSLIFATAGPLFASIALAKFYFESAAPKPTWPQILTLTAISLPILLGLSIIISNAAGWIMIMIQFKEVTPTDGFPLSALLEPHFRPLANTLMTMLIGTLFIFPKQVELRRKKAGLD